MFLPVHHVNINLNTLRDSFIVSPVNETHQNVNSCRLIARKATQACYSCVSMRWPDGYTPLKLKPMTIRLHRSIFFGLELSTCRTSSALSVIFPKNVVCRLF